ncbi:hypothetical protein, partial [Phocaeicola vulgatus]|uniref:hypothetical protein n=1 Tax=Phocaeicola vulgatus TaxID=821 RepID=UPI0034A5172B
LKVNAFLANIQEGRSLFCGDYELFRLKLLVQEFVGCHLICNLKILRGWNRALNIVLWGVACIICIMLYEAVTDSFYI